MKRSNVLGADKKTIEYQLALKKAEYTAAMKQGKVFNELKEIFLEIKALQQRLDADRSDATKMKTQMRTAS